ncbi:MAG: tRNA (N(6)-L-threonylcarbamoyladenosine(37)-C(2))-methylthiotransferase MtaB [Clostridiales bacterium]|nr:tRNA (N(6)-L-threonylcarbamoyladenosine(37)-C(2))-methylthiotransferase MtaB [Clostridiales bacterium]MDU3241812.1 tRNA (N(6)-L-threonylcarbamoyladenosine(37)-C(2))-methylthiotransferase MtaB [Clostridiales bacterium]
MNQKTVALHNLGCKVNAYETEAMQQILQENGYKIVPFEPGADIYIINTCTVTNIADRKSRQMLHKAKKMNPGAIVVAAGCYVQASKEELKKDDAIDIVIGNNKKKDLVSILKSYEINQEEEDAVIDVNHTSEYENLTISRTAEHTRAYIKVQDGCNQFCSYCIIPYARGRVRSRDIEDVKTEVGNLAKAGYQEVVLTGIHLSSYGIDLGLTLLELIREVHKIEGIKRIRLGSLEPRIITEEFAKELSSMEKICPHFHLSLQSGCDETLSRMNRRYDTKEFEEKCMILRRYFELPALTTDVIVGFPGETEEEFKTTKEFLKRICFFETHIFKYSRRKGTKAAVMENQIDENVKNIRSQELIRLNEENQTAYEERFLGKETEILFEEKITVEEKEYYIGHTREYIKAACCADADYANCLLNKTLRGRLKNHLLLCEN